MNKIHVLDCTLRDGGYCNQWKFGFHNVKKITRSLIDANVDIIECGFLTNKVTYNKEITKFTTLDEIAAVIPDDRKHKLFVTMMNYGEYNVDDLPEYDGSSLDGIRVAFHKKNLSAALEVCRKIKEKGYKVFVQAMVSLSYSDNEFLSLIQAMNQMEPYAFYIVDSFGMMKKKNLIRLFYMIENNLKDGIWIGFHSHNNMQLAYSNAQSLVDAQTNRDLIIDCSVYGMGRGAGNLNTELFVEYLNENTDGTYNLKPLLNVIDEILNDFYQKNYWGYSLPNYVSAVYGTHPNYAAYLSEKNTLTVEAMDEIFSMMSQEKRFEFDKDYIEQLYLKYMATGETLEEHKAELKEKLADKKVLLIAPGKSSGEEADKIVAFASKEDVVVIGVNFDYPYCQTDFIFSSNLRRFRELPAEKHGKCIVTSNIPADEVYLQTSYFDLLLPIESVQDNAGLMSIKYFSSLGVKDIYLTGFDGYSYDVHQNYAIHQMELITGKAVVDAMNEGMKQMLKQFREKVNISWLTKPHNIDLE
jgi:4-hydroxy 2-oxovalerate aldolase